MTKCTQASLRFPGCQGRRVEADFSGGEITGDAGVLLLRQADGVLKLSEAVSRALRDSRRRASCEHASLSLVRQRLYALALGYEDLNDHQGLRGDVALQTAVGRTRALASASTLSRWENRSDRAQAWRLHEVLVEQFIGSFRHAPRQLVLDFDATDDRVHGGQEGRFFHGYYDHYCFLPLYVFCGDRVLVSYLRPSKIDGAKHAWAILALLVKHQGAAAGSVRRPHQLPRLVGEPVPVADVELRVRAAGGDPPARAQGHRTGPRLCRHDPAEAIEDWRGDHPQYPAHPVAARQRLSLSGLVLPGRREAAPRLAPDPRTADSSGTRW